MNFYTRALHNHYIANIIIWLMFNFIGWSYKCQWQKQDFLTDSQLYIFKCWYHFKYQEKGLWIALTTNAKSFVNFPMFNYTQNTLCGNLICWCCLRSWMERFTQKCAENEKKKYSFNRTSLGFIHACFPISHPPCFKNSLKSEVLLLQHDQNLYLKQNKFFELQLQEWLLI